MHLRARWYNAASGSFASVDPYAGDPASPASLAPYMYAYNQPTLFTDPSGRCADPVSATLCAVGVVAGTTLVLGASALVLGGATIWQYSGHSNAETYRANLADGTASVLHGGQGTRECGTASVAYVIGCAPKEYFRGNNQGRNLNNDITYLEESGLFQARIFNPLRLRGYNYEHWAVRYKDDTITDPSLFHNLRTLLGVNHVDLPSWMRYYEKHDTFT